MQQERSQTKHSQPEHFQLIYKSGNCASSDIITPVMCRINIENPSQQSSSVKSLYHFRTTGDG